MRLSAAGSRSDTSEEEGCAGGGGSNDIACEADSGGPAALVAELATWKRRCEELEEQLRAQGAQYALKESVLRQETQRQQRLFGTRKRELERRESEVARREKAVEKQHADLAVQMRILEAKAKQLCLNVDRQAQPTAKTDHIVPAPRHWANQAMDESARFRLFADVKEEKALLGLLQASALHSVCEGRDGCFEVQKVKRVCAWRVENPILWRQYQNKAEELRQRHRREGGQCEALRPEVPECEVAGMPIQFRWRSTGIYDARVNEVMVWHGTKSANVNNIAKAGFDERVCSLEGMFGAGLYFAQDSCKSGQYAEVGDDNSHWFFLCRVTLGQPYIADEPMPSVRKAPDGFDSIVFDPSDDSWVGHHRELVVYDRHQVYPEYIVRAFV